MRGDRVPESPAISLSALATGVDRWLGWGAILAAILLVTGWVLPIMTVERLLFLSSEISILQGVGELWSEDEIFLAVVIGTFSIAVPAVKLALALYLWFHAEAGSRRLHRALTLLEMAGRWSMLDVFVIALLVVAIRTSLIDDVTVHAGIYVFTAAIVLSLVVVQRMAVLARRAVVREVGDEKQAASPPDG
jgi:paraquat-inducible protein A